MRKLLMYQVFLTAFVLLIYGVFKSSDDVSVSTLAEHMCFFGIIVMACLAAVIPSLKLLDENGDISIYGWVLFNTAISLLFVVIKDINWFPELGLKINFIPIGHIIIFTTFSGIVSVVMSFCIMEWRKERSNEIFWIRGNWQKFALWLSLFCQPIIMGVGFYTIDYMLGNRVLPLAF